MFLAGAQNLDANKEYINQLNVFPVPDGDTGTNMTLTIMSAAKDVQALDNKNMADLCKAISTGSLRGARGNSGVILSQLLRGFTKSVRELEEIDVPALAAAMTKAADTAYKAVMKPKEGTILTVARGMANKAEELAGSDLTMEEFISAVISYGDEVLDHTPDLLPVLKQAGVVDSGGQGLITVCKGAFDAFMGKEITINIQPADTVKKNFTQMVPKADIDTANIKYGYCTEFIVLLEHPLPDEEVLAFKSYLESIGDSIVCVADDELIKIHVHTNNPGLAFEKALTLGALDRMKIDNMRLEHEEKLEKDANRILELQAEEAAANAAKAKAKPVELKEYGFVSVCAGDGLKEIFESLNVDYVISGGQTMNPSTSDFLDAVEQIPAKTIFALPNNKNVILAAEQAAKLSKDKKIIVIPTKTVPQGITAVINFDPASTPEDNEAVMKEESSKVKTGEVTYATRDTCIDGKQIAVDDIMGIGDSKILSVGQSINDTTLDMLSQMVDDDTVLISVYFGADITQEDADVLVGQITEKFPSCDVDVHSGGQPVYYYIVSAE
ncbi:MAG: DAK2 domain-containing protein [Lachnospiraceae bacterium]|nr:DAK2 domain-containing protein [Lachnospiraceae bacterium]